MVDTAWRRLLSVAVALGALLSTTVGLSQPFTGYGGIIDPGFWKGYAGSISDAVCSVEYTMTATAGTTYDITMEALPPGNLDCLLELFAGDPRRLVASNDNAASLLNATDSHLAWTCPTSGTYTLSATRFGKGTGPTQGPYFLRVTRQGAGSVNNGLLQPYQTLIGPISNVGTGVEYTISQVPAGTAMTVVAQTVAGNLDPVIRLRDGSGQVAANDDGWFDANCHVGYTTPISTGHTLAIGHFKGRLRTTGVYATRLITGPAPAPGIGGALIPHQAVMGVLAPGTAGTVTYTFAGEKDDSLTLTVTGGFGLTPSLVLLDPSGTRVGTVSPAARGFGPPYTQVTVLHHKVTTPGGYTVRVESGGGPLQIQGIMQGVYVLTMTKAVLR